MDTNATPSAPRSMFAPATLLVGDLLIRFLTYAEHIDFLLSVRDEKFATMLEFFRDSGWWIVAIGSALWLLYEWNHRKSHPAGSIGALIFSAALVAFSAGVLITVSATGTLPMILQNYAGDAGNKTCSAAIDTSRLKGFADGYHLILLCGAGDLTTDPQEDTRIAVSNGFHINGGPMTIVTPLGKMEDVWKDQLPTHAGQAFSFTMAYSCGNSEGLGPKHHQARV
jgi:hypothetical protein